MNKSPEWKKLNCAESQKILRINFNFAGTTMKLPVELMKTLISAIHFICHYWRCRVNLRGFGGEAKSCMNDKFG